MNQYRLLPLLLLTACGKGCDGPEPKLPAVVADVTVARADDPSLLPIERELDLRLPDRATGTVLPVMAMLPYRKLPNFEVGKHLVARIDAHSLKILEREVRDARFDSDEDVLTLFRLAAQDFRERAGLEPNRLVLVVDALTPVQVTGRLRQLAITAQEWRVVALAKEGQGLVELTLMPPPSHRPAASPVDSPTPTAR